MAVVFAFAKSSGMYVTPAVAAASAAVWTRSSSTYHLATSTDSAVTGMKTAAASIATRTAA